MRKTWARRIPIFLAIVLIAAAALSLLLMMLWNWLAPGLFQLPRITIWQALGLLVLSKLLFGGLRGGPGGRRRDHWRHRMLERWEQMTPDERQAFRRGLRSGAQQTAPNDEGA